MDFEIPESLVPVLQGMLPDGTPLSQRLKEHGACRGSWVVPSRLFDAASLNMLYTLCKAQNERELMFQLLALDNIYSAPDARPIPSLDKLIPGLVAYLARDAIDGWLYRRNRDGTLLPWLVDGMRHIVPDQGQPYVVISLLANTLQAATADPHERDTRQRRTGMTNAIMVYPYDIENRTIPELLAENGYYKECAEFKTEYEQHAERFLQLQSRYGSQVVAQRAAFIATPKGIELQRIPAGTTTKCVNDEEVLDRRFETGADAMFWRSAGMASGFDRVPLHCYLYLYDLSLHRNIWVHVQHVAEYRYRPELRDKLVLPADHRNLIDILTADMNVVMPDIIDGKSGGTTILCKGAPGLGKTLTAEVYAEVVGKPLYRVHSGQLGTSAQSVEASLSQILQRAARWDSILLLDEADVYIRQRDNDLQHNAIVAEFLRTLEYFSGLLFMTTNRSGDIDDAILSRCIAIVTYEHPSRDDAARLWHLLADQFHVNLPFQLVDQLIDAYPHASGRDIKELLKLTTKFCKRKGEPLSLAAFATCARFRGVTSMAQ